MSDQPTPDRATPGRDLLLAGLPNARDLGGYPAAEGPVVRSGLLLRAESLTNATAGDLDSLAALGVGLACATASARTPRLCAPRCLSPGHVPPSPPRQGVSAA
jgi:hypothetical protein